MGATSNDGRAELVRDVTATMAEWTSSLAADEIPEPTARRAGWQWASVVGSILAVADHPKSVALGNVALAGRIEVSFDEAMNAGMRAEGERGFDLAAALGAEARTALLDGATFTDYESRFPAMVELTLDDGTTWGQTTDIPRGGAGRPEDETRELVRAKLEDQGAPKGAFDQLERLVELSSARQISELVCDRSAR